MLAGVSSQPGCQAAQPGCKLSNCKTGEENHKRGLIMAAKNKRIREIDTLQSTVQILQLRVASLEGQLLATLERLKQVEKVEG